MLNLTLCYVLLGIVKVLLLSILQCKCSCLFFIRLYKKVEWNLYYILLPKWGWGIFLFLLCFFFFSGVLVFFSSYRRLCFHFKINYNCKHILWLFHVLLDYFNIFVGLINVLMDLSSTRFIISTLNNLSKKINWAVV